MKEVKTPTASNLGSAAQKVRAAVKPTERIMQIVFLLCGLIAVAFVPVSYTHL